MSWFRRDGERLTLTLHIQPGAAKTALAGLYGDALKIRVSAPPVDGAANIELIRFLCSLLDVPRSAVTLKHGASGRSKIVEITGVPEGAEARLLAGG